MIGASLLLAAQAAVQVPVTPADVRPDPSASHSIVVATTAEQRDPRPIACGEPACTSWYTASFAKAVSLIGPPLPTEFAADLEMGSPFNQPYRLALVVEQRPGAPLRVIDLLGFHSERREACFGPEIAALFPTKAANAGVMRRGRTLCVEER